jgi:hypothetical protein
VVDQPPHDPIDASWQPSRPGAVASIKKPPDVRHPAERQVGNAAIIALTVIGRQRNKDSTPGPTTTRYCADFNSRLTGK